MRLRSAVVAALAYEAACVLALVGLLPSLAFHPRTGTWSFHALPGELAQRWYGIVATAIVVAMLACAVAIRIERTERPAAFHDRAPWLVVGAWLIATAFVIAREIGK
ncbi:MAG: hypothetical protein U0166_08475 [Acidobacteriota bacterium]